MAPSKNPENCPMMSFAQGKKTISPTFQISGALVILCPKERARPLKGQSYKKSHKGDLHYPIPMRIIRVKEKKDFLV